VGAGLGLTRDRLDRTLRATSDLPRLAGVPIVGYLPWVRPGRGGRGLAQQLGQPSSFQESVRALFGRCVLVPGKAPRTVMVGSSEVGEGKTFLTLAMALFAASTGRRVLVIEADLRRPTFATALRLTDSLGLSEFLRSSLPVRGRAPLADIVTSYHGLDVITAGKPAIDSTELLSGARFDTLLRVAAASYDLVILDSPPSLLLMDAHVLARRVDGIIYCASFGRSRLDRVLRGIRELSGAGGRVLGIVVGGRGGDVPRYDVPGLNRGSYLPAGQA
jgi:capsular exopolysaccharide synthesis family protein